MVEQDIKAINPDHRWFRQRFRKGSIRSRLLAAFMGTVLFTALIIVISSVIVGFRTGQQREFDELEAVADLKETEIEAWLNSLQADVTLLQNQQATLSGMQIVLQNKTYRGVISNILRNDLEQVRSLSGRFVSFFLVDLDGRVGLSTDENQEGLLVGNELYFQRGQEEAFVQLPLYSSSDDKITMFVSRPIFEPRGRLVGVLVGQVNVAQLNEIMRSQGEFGTTVETYLVNREQTLITSPPVEGYGSGDTMVESEGIRLALDENVNGVGVYDNYQGGTVIGVYRWLPALETALLVEELQATAIRPLLPTLGVNIFIAIGAVMVAMFVGLQVTRSIAAPLGRLADTSTKIARGDLELRARVERLDEIGEVAQAFNLMTERLRGLIGGLEERVASRTQALEIQAEISTQLTGLLDEEQILAYVVDYLQREFDFYHTHIYLHESTTQDLVMAKGAGEIGRQIKAQNHRLGVGQGIVGMVAETNTPFVSNNVDEVLNFVRNTLLPATRSEIAVPLRKGNEILGVLDVQSELINRFSLEDQSLLQTIANQTATALDNAHQIAKTQEAIQEVERLNRQLLRQSWEQTEQEGSTRGYYFSKGQSQAMTPDSDIWLPPMKQAAAEKRLVRETRAKNGGEAATELALPLVLRKQVIGVLGVKRENNTDWSTEEVSAVEAVASQIALALENARLSEEQEKTIIQLQEVDRIKSEFLTSMSHELRTPLNSIIGFADVIIQGIDGEVSDLALNDVKLIHNSGQHLLALINDILDISKIEAGMMELVQEPLDMQEVVEHVLGATRSLLNEKPDVNILVNMNADLPPVFSDKLRLNQVLLNLVSNAIKFTKEGDINITASVDRDNPKMMFVSVLDSGIGIPAEKFSAIFDRFSQADMTTTREYGGTGLGLPICKQLIELHGGTIGVTSEVGTGSEFFFTMPLADIEYFAQ